MKRDVFPKVRAIPAACCLVISSSPGLNEPNMPFDSTSEIADDDGISYSTKSADNGEYAAQRFVFTLNESAANVERLNVTWKGSGTHDNASATQGAGLYIWNGSNYEDIANTSSNSTTTLTGGNISVATNYVVDGNVTVLVMQNAPGESTIKKSHLATDYVKLVVTHHNTNSKYTL